MEKDKGRDKKSKIAAKEPKGNTDNIIQNRQSNADLYSERNSVAYAFNPQIKSVGFNVNKNGYISVSDGDSFKNGRTYARYKRARKEAIKK